MVDSNLGLESREWADSTFDPNLISGIPTVINKKQFRKLSHVDAVEKLEQIYRHLHMLLELKNRVRSKTTYYDKIVKTIDGLMAEKPCSLVRISYEMALFRQRVEHDEMVLYLLDEEPWGTFLRREIVQVHP